MPAPKPGFHNAMPVAIKPTAKNPMPALDEKTPKRNPNAVQIRMKDRGYSLAKPKIARPPTASEEATTVPDKQPKAALSKGDIMQDDLVKSMNELDDLFKGPKELRERYEAAKDSSMDRGAAALNGLAVCSSCNAHVAPRGGGKIKQHYVGNDADSGEVCASTTARKSTAAERAVEKDYAKKAPYKISKGEESEKVETPKIEYEFPGLKPGTSLLHFEKFPDADLVTKIENGDLDPSPSKKILLPG